jgi:predicted aconitase with swiveling domain
MVSSVMFQGKVVAAGVAAGELLISSEPLSFWGGFDFHSGTIIDKRHVLSGQSAVGRILALPFTRGSSSTTAVLLEAIKAKTAPAAIITTKPDAFFALASIVADEIYGTPIPLIALSNDDFLVLQKLPPLQTLRIDDAGNVETL